MLSAALTLLALFIAVIATPPLRRLRGKGMPEILAVLLISAGAKIVRLKDGEIDSARGTVRAHTAQRECRRVRMRRIRNGHY